MQPVRALYCSFVSVQPTFSCPAPAEGSTPKALASSPSPSGSSNAGAFNRLALQLPAPTCPIDPLATPSRLTRPPVSVSPILGPELGEGKSALPLFDTRPVLRKAAARRLPLNELRARASCSARLVVGDAASTPALSSAPAAPLGPAAPLVPTPPVVPASLVLMGTGRRRRYAGKSPARPDKLPLPC